MIRLRTVERIVKDNEVVEITCSRCNAKLRRVANTMSGGVWDGGFLEGKIFGLEATPGVEVAWEFCPDCLNELRVWVGNDGDPSKGRRDMIESP